MAAVVSVELPLSSLLAGVVVASDSVLASAESVDGVVADPSAMVVSAFDVLLAMSPEGVVVAAEVPSVGGVVAISSLEVLGASVDGGGVVTSPWNNRRAKSIVSTFRTEGDSSLRTSTSAMSESSFVSCSTRSELLGLGTRRMDCGATRLGFRVSIKSNSTS